jgi:hypothetical protein
MARERDVYDYHTVKNMFFTGKCIFPLEKGHSRPEKVRFVQNIRDLLNPTSGYLDLREVEV